MTDVAMPTSLFSALERLRSHFDSVSSSIDDRVTKTELSRLVKPLSEGYEFVVAAIRAEPSTECRELGDSLATLRPSNYYRNIFHVFNASFGACMYEFFLSFEQATFVLVFILMCYIFMDILRRYFPQAEALLYDTLFSVITRPRERYIIPAATWYCVGLVAVVVMFDKTAAIIAALVLSIGDPMATLVGRRWGKTPLFVAQKSLEGTSAFFLSSFVYVLIFLMWRRPGLGSPHSILLSFVAAIVGALAEMFGNDTFDDNLTIPLSVGLIIHLLL
eukprot:m.5859 g.5859  ORF g.5859 m.5859 type:complete len:275 (-) comp5679_c0_seq1:22-846(-)